MYLDVSLVREDVGEVEVAGDPIDGQSADSVGADAAADDVRQFGAVGPRAVHAVEFVLVELDPVDPIVGHVHVDVQNIVARTGDRYLAAGGF